VAVLWRPGVALVSVILALLFVRVAAAQEPRDPLIDPAQGGAGSRFQIVGQRGWTAGEAITLRVGYTASDDPLAHAGPWQLQQTVTVLRDGTWSFPIVLTDEFFGGASPALPGYVVVRADSATQTAVNAYVFTVNGSRPSGADAFAPLGFGRAVPAPLAVTAALFAAGLGALFVMSGAMRRMGPGAAEARRDAA
jgi:hypothetical protein